MFVGHYAAAIAIAATRPRKKGLLSYLSFCAVLPDLLMMTSSLFHTTLNYHADIGLLYCLIAVLAIGSLFRFERTHLYLGVLSLGLHLPLDYFYMSSDSTNLYAHPWTDFILESLLILTASFFFVKRHDIHSKKLKWFALAISLIISFQAFWNFYIN